jgi:hypothetical protein
MWVQPSSSYTPQTFMHTRRHKRPAVSSLAESETSVSLLYSTDVCRLLLAAENLLAVLKSNIRRQIDDHH